MTISDKLMIGAVLLAPIIAVQVQKILERLREIRQRKIYIFHTLMATRAARVSLDHVQALNMIDLAFYGHKVFGKNYRKKSEQNVLDAWKVYLDHLAAGYLEVEEKQNRSEKKQDRDAETKNWVKTGDNLFVDLLSEMAGALGYHFDRVVLKKGIYSPKAHGEIETDQILIRKNLVEILAGRKSLPIKDFTEFSVNSNELNEERHLRLELIACLQGKKPFPVKIIDQKREVDE